MNLAAVFLENLDRVELTNTQYIWVKAIKLHGNPSAAAKAMGKEPSGGRKIWRDIQQKFADVGIAPDVGVSHPQPHGQLIKGISTLYKGDKPIMQWVKTGKKEQELRNIAKELLAGIKDDLPRAEKTKAPKRTDSDLCTQYTITDYHLGMLAWGEETGENWDIKIAEKLLIDWFAHAIESAPNSEQALFAQIGDFLHWDGIEAVTPTSKHVLDADTRFQNVIRVALRVIRKIIEMLLEKHKNVHVIMAEGNHDTASSMWLKEALSLFYESEPRVTVDTRPDPYYCFTFGDNVMFFHHGHKRNMSNIDTVFVSKFREEYGKAKHVYADMGHYHHDKKIETNLMTVTQHRTLAAPDAHASRGGYMSGRDAKVTIYHKQHGRVQEMVISPAMVAA